MLELVRGDQRRALGQGRIVAPHGLVPCHVADHRIGADTQAADGIELDEIEAGDTLQVDHPRRRHDRTRLELGQQIGAAGKDLVAHRLVVTQGRQRLAQALGAQVLELGHAPIKDGHTQDLP
jgi:hypothetical protein